MNGPPTQRWVEHIGGSICPRYRLSFSAYALDANVGILKVSGPWRTSMKEAEDDEPKLRLAFEKAYRGLWDQESWPAETPATSS